MRRPILWQSSCGLNFSKPEKPYRSLSRGTFKGSPKAKGLKGTLKPQTLKGTLKEALKGSIKGTCKGTLRVKARKLEHHYPHALKVKYTGS